MELVAVSATILSLYTTILATGEEIRGNEKRCRRLIERLGVFVAPLKRIESADLVVDKEALLRLREAFIDARDLVARFSSSSWAAKAVNFKSVASEFESITYRLNIARDDLHFDMVINKYAMEKEDKRDTEDDFENLQGNLESMLVKMMDQRDRKDEQRYQTLLNELKKTRVEAGEDLCGFLEVDYENLTMVDGAELGEGSFGVVSKVTYHGRTCAMKSLSKAATVLTQKDITDLREEVKIHAKLRWEFVVQLLAASTVRPHLCLVMELAPHGNLFELLHIRNTQLSWTDRCAMIWDMASAIAYLHSKSILHRDIKSPNILVFDFLRLKLCDFGLAKVKSATRATRGGTTQAHGAGTACWMAPEIHDCQKHTEAADIYSTAVVMYEIIVRQIPFFGMHDFQIMRTVCDKGLRPPVTPREKDDPPLREQLLEVMENCWDGDPSKRMKSVALRDTLCDIVKRHGGDSRSNMYRTIPPSQFSEYGSDATGMTASPSDDSVRNLPLPPTFTAPPSYHTQVHEAPAPASVVVPPALPSSYRAIADEQPSSYRALNDEQPTTTPVQPLSTSDSMPDDLAKLRALRVKPAELKQEIDFVVQVMQTYPDEACTCIGVMCHKDPETAISLGTKGLCTLALTTLQSCNGSAATLSKIIEAIARLSTVEQNRAIFAGIDAGARILAYTTVPPHTEEIAIQRSAFLALANLSLNADIRRQLIANGGCAAVIGAMKKYVEVPLIQELGNDVIVNLAIVPKGVMTKKSSSSFLFSSKASVTDSNRHLVAMREAGVCEAVILAMKTHPEHVRVQTSCCVAIVALSENEANQKELGDKGACELVANAIIWCGQVTPCDESISKAQEEGIRAVLNLCSFNKENKVRFSKTSVFDGLQVAVQNPSLSPVTIKLAESAMCSVSETTSGERLMKSFKNFREGKKPSSDSL